MPSDAPELTIELNDQELLGLSSPGMISPLNPIRYMRDAIAKRMVRVQKDGKDIDLTGCSLASAVGNPDVPVTGGTFTITYGAATSAALVYNVSAANLATAINGLAGIPAGGVTVSLVGTLYTIRFVNNGARTLFEVDAGLITPPATPSVVRVDPPGDASHKEEQEFSLSQTPFATSDNWVLHQGGVATSNLDFAGDTGLPARWTISFEPPPLSGSLVVTLVVTQIETITVLAANGADADGEWFTIAAGSGLTGWWITDGTTTDAPAALVALGPYYTQVVSVSAGDTANQVSNKIWDAITDSFLFYASDGPPVTTVTNIYPGARAAASVSDSSKLAVAVTVTGATISSLLPIGATGDQLAAILGTSFAEVTVGDDNLITLIYAENGSQTNLTLDDSAVLYPQYFEGSMGFIGAPLENGFAQVASTVDRLECITEFALTRPSEEADCILQYPSLVFRNLIRSGTTYNPDSISGDPQTTGNLLWVDAVYGTATGVRNRFDRPFSTPTLAQAAAISGDTIIVRPGVYTTTATLAAHEVDWDLISGASISKANAGAIFDDGGGAMTFNVRGSGVLTHSAAGTNNCVLRTSHASSVVNFECITATANGRAIATDAGTANIRVINATSTSLQGVDCTGGSQTIHVQNVIAGAEGVHCVTGTQRGWVGFIDAGGYGVSCDGGVQTLHVLHSDGASGSVENAGDGTQDVIINNAVSAALGIWNQSTNPQTVTVNNVTAGTIAILNDDAGTMTVNVTGEAVGSTAIEHNGTKTRLRGRYRSTGTNNPAGTVNSNGLVLYGAILIAHTGATFSLNAPSAVSVSAVGSGANKDVDSDITVTAGGLIADASLT